MSDVKIYESSDISIEWRPFAKAEFDKKAEYADIRV